MKALFSQSWFFPTLFLVLVLGLTFQWKRELGWWRAISAAVCRLVTLACLMLCLYPKETNESVPPLGGQEPLAVFLDNTNSMQSFGLSITEEDEFIQALDSYCRELNCRVSLKRYSDYFKEKDVSFLDEALGKWAQSLKNEPWIILSDAGDANANFKWSRDVQALKDKGRGLVLAYRDFEDTSLRVSQVKDPLFAFANKPFNLEFVVSRSKAIGKPENSQVQVLSGDTILAAQTIRIAENDLELVSSLKVPPLAKGKHFLTLRILGNTNDRSLLDNELSLDVEVLEDTIGILHLLGAPTWDGRFMRRQLKLEPKYDLVSFYILRDPWDEQVVEERELSLIPFPVDKLFNEELANFKLVIMQNFSMKRFLTPEHQKNLLNFIEKGGSLLFVGGPRAFTDADIGDEDFRRLLPFQMRGPVGSDSFLNYQDFGNDESTQQSKLAFDHLAVFKLEIAAISSENRQIASLYDPWKVLLSDVDEVSWTGLHAKTDEVLELKPNVLRLLDARLNSGQTKPLALASFPGKGRAVWLLSDQSWTLAMSQEKQIPRQLYAQFYDSALRWLLREELAPPLKLSDYSLSLRENFLTYSVVLTGVASALFDEPGQAQVFVCGRELSHDQMSQQVLGPNQRILSGRIASSSSQDLCKIEIMSSSAKYGDLQVQAVASYPQIYSDEKRPNSDAKAQMLAEQTEAKLEWVGALKGQDLAYRVSTWLRDLPQFKAVLQVSPISQVSKDYFWPFKNKWILIFLFCALLGETLIRRWKFLAT